MSRNVSLTLSREEFGVVFRAFMQATRGSFAREFNNPETSSVEKKLNEAYVRIA